MIATLRSNDGQSALILHLGSVPPCAPVIAWESSLRIEGRLWDGDHDFPFSVSIDGFGVCIASLTALHTHIGRWVNLPLEELIAEVLDGEFSLAGLSSQRLDLRFGARQDTISSRKPVLSIQYFAGALCGEFHFVTDPSCLAQFAQALSVYLQSLDRSEPIEKSP